jgi:phosphatidylserine/phosphatidylglycerophosphate/cardiolipin synthase-like enzyme
MTPSHLSECIAAALGLVAGACLAWAAFAPGAQHHFAPVENLEALDVREIDAARARIDLAAYVLTDVPVIDALARAAARGVHVRIYREGRETPERPTSPRVESAFNRLAAAPHAVIRYKSDAAPLMHLKAYCVDGHVLRTGAANFSSSGETAQDNDALLLRGPGVCAALDAHFEKMWRR